MTSQAGGRRPLDEWRGHGANTTEGEPVDEKHRSLRGKGGQKCGDSRMLIDRSEKKEKKEREREKNPVP